MSVEEISGRSQRVAYKQVKLINGPMKGPRNVSFLGYSKFCDKLLAHDIVCYNFFCCSNKSSSIIFLLCTYLDNSKAIEAQTLSEERLPIAMSEIFGQYIKQPELI